MLAPTLLAASARSLIDLPPELLTAICAFADCHTVLGCRAVCHQLKDVIDASVELQYRIELAMDGMIDGPPSALSTGERLASLRALRRSWATLSWTSQVTVPMPGPCCAYELVGGLFCKTQPRRNWDAAHPHAGHVVGSRTMSTTWLPSTHARARTEVRDDLGIPTRDFAVDPSQDLMVLFRGGVDVGMAMAVVFPGALELHIRTISTNQTHPDARVAVLCTPVLFPVASVFIQIVDDVLGMMYCVDPARPRITIWNWKTGSLVVDRGSGNLPYGTWDFSFINSRALFITSGNGNGSLEIFTFSCDGRDCSQPAAGPLTHVASLHLPGVLPSVRVLSVGTHTGPFLAGCPRGKPFTASNQERIHVLTIQYMSLPTFEGPRTRPRVCMFLHNRVFEGYIARHTGQSSSSSSSPPPPAAVPWWEWGRTHTRVLPHVGIFQWLRYVHGQRVVILPQATETGKSRMHVLDFNVRGGAPPPPDAACETTTTTTTTATTTLYALVDYPTRIAMPNIFVDVVESGLPFREARRDVCAEYSGVMIDDERLVGLKYPAFLTGDMKEIDVFTM